MLIVRVGSSLVCVWALKKTASLDIYKREVATSPWFWLVMLHRMTELSCGDHIPFSWIMLVMVPDWAPAKSREETEMLKKSFFVFFFLKIGCFCVLKILCLLIQELAGGKGGRLGLSWLCLCPRASCMRRGHNVWFGASVRQTQVGVSVGYMWPSVSRASY